jgi:hypothetical protein
MHRSPRQANPPEDVTNNPQMQYNIGKTENLPIHVPTFLQKNNGDLAIKANNVLFLICFHVLISLLQNFFPKLRAHLLPRIQEILQQKAASLLEHSGRGTTYNAGRTVTLDGDHDACNSVFLKKDRIYHHNLSRFHFTTYDVQRGNDIINPRTSRCNIMLLANDAATDDSANPHHFLYARVLGVYHANVIYTGPGMRDYEARRLDFLWVRWYEVVDPASSGWHSSKLDSVRFLPMNEDDAFGFVDPKDVLRGCHIMPNFAKGKRHADGIGISRCAKDGKDYNRYYVGR